ncbi:MAG: Mrp/NBP35 family ATP-binding protein [Eubacteriaceae bacterium]|jgi:Mrp family chromosome partitioning ATPase
MNENESAKCTAEDCSSCGADCSSRMQDNVNDKAGHPWSDVRKVIGVVSGKGGVGKSLVTASMAVAMRARGNAVGIMDADITGPSIPKMFGIEERAQANDQGILPGVSRDGISMISMNMLLDNDTDPVVWRGPIIGGAVKQFWTDVQWMYQDYLFVDMPPGTGDVALTVFQSMPVDGIIIVTTPQDLVSMIVEKAVKMANEMKIPILGIVENMSWMECPDCGKKLYPFGESHISEIVEKYHIPLIGQIPLDPQIAALADAGKIEDIKTEWLAPAADVLGSL